MIDLDTTRADYVAERPVYQALARNVERSIRRAAQRAGLHHLEFSSRAKDVRSFLRKALSGKYNDPIHQITDKAGVRVVGAYLRELPAVENLIRQRRFEVVERVDKGGALAEHELGYLGLHLLITPDAGPMSGKLCEVQIRTRAEDLWSRLSHESLYKGPDVLTGAERRRVIRLAALLEIFDSEADTTWGRILSAPDYVVGRAVDALEQNLFKVAPRREADALTSDILRDVLRPAYSVEDRGRIEAIMNEFTATNRSKLKEVYRNYRDDTDHLLLHRPEALMVFQQLDEDPFQLTDRWIRFYPVSLLQALADVWGVRIEPN